ncbi:MAG TPA: hypothetical protein H9717_05495 [Candidatus Eisenbergiella merdipullorum]|uniref:DUF5666 domain-containing protein n=1 Tax=Candidatus Eisenbergiella merdipullorum TaxID=2838553 RepID=A0A9D2I6H6_9FIRM|nr:hypothetical protein [Candidatus Eisenbergiella merdipullorum]
MNKGKENYQNIPLPDGLSNAVQKGIKKGKRHMEKKWIAAIGTLAAACVLGFVVLRVLPADLRTPQEGDAASQSRMVPSDGQTPEAAAFTAAETATDDSTEPASPEDPTAAVENTAPSSIRVYGTVTQIEDGQILLENDEEGAAYPQVLLNLTEDTLILSGTDCSERSLSDIAVGDTLCADISPAMTRSIPPMANAFAVFCEIPEDAAVPAYAQITDISTGDDGYLRITTDQDLILIPGEDTSVLSLDGSKTLSVSDLAAGDTILVRYSIMTMSIPAQTSPEEIRLVAKADAAAQDSSSADDSSAAAAESDASSSIRVTGTVTQIKNGQILLENDEEGAAYPQVLLNLTEDTLILSGSDCSEKALSDISVGDTLYADISPAMTRSIPPMANAFVVFCEIPKDTAVPTYAVITDIQTGEDGSVRIITDQNLILIPDDAAEVLSLDGDTQLSLSDLAVGDAILARFQVMTASLPAQANPEEIRVIGGTDEIQ